MFACPDGEPVPTSPGHARSCSLRISARASDFHFDLLPTKRGEPVLAPKKRERSAVKAQMYPPRSCEERTGLAIDRFRLTALHLGVIRWWDPSAPPACPGSLGPDHLTRRRDGRFHPGLPDEPGGLLHTSPEGTACESHARGSPIPIHIRFACRTPLSEWGYVRHTHATRHRQAMLKIIFEGVWLRQKDVDGRDVAALRPAMTSYQTLMVRSANGSAQSAARWRVSNHEARFSAPPILRDAPFRRSSG